MSMPWEDFASSAAPSEPGPWDDFKASESSSNSPDQPYSWSGLGVNAVKDVGRNISGLANAGLAAGKTMYQLATGPSPYTSPSEAFQNALQTPVAKAIQAMPQTVLNDAKSFAEHPIDSMYRNPVTTALMATAVASKAIPAAESLGVKGLSAALGPSQEAIEARLANPQAIKTAVSYPDLAHQLPDTLNSLKDQISQHAEQAYGTLRDSTDPSQGAIPKADVHSIVTDLVDKLRTGGSLVGSARKGAVENLNSVLQDINNVGGQETHLSESHIKDIIRSIDKNVNWQDKGASETNGALTNLRGQLDQALKSQNPNYAQAMQPVADKMGLLTALKKAFNLTNQTGEGLQPTDTTISKLQSAPTERKSITQGLLNELKSATGQDYLQKAKDYGYSKQFQGGSPNGSRRVVSFGGIGTAIGAGLGKLTGSPGTGAIIGEGLGSGLGLMADKYGGPMAAAITDAYSPTYNRIARLVSSAPAQSARQAALLAYLSHLYGSKSQGDSR